MTFEERDRLMRDGVLRVPSQYGEPTPITRALIEDGRAIICCWRADPADCKVRLLHGQADPDVPWEIALRTAEQVTSRDVEIMLIKDGDHRLSRPRDLALLKRTVAALLRQMAARPSRKLGYNQRNPGPVGFSRRATLRFSAQKLSAIGLMAGAASAKATAGGGGTPIRRAASSTTSALSAGTSSVRFRTRRPGGALLPHRRGDGAADVVAMDAAELVARFDHPPRRAGTQIVERGSARAINAGESDDIDRASLGKADHALFGVEATLASRLRGRRRGVLIDPVAVAIAVNGGAGQIADPAQARRGGDGRSRNGAARDRRRASGAAVTRMCVAVAIAGSAASKGTSSSVDMVPNAPG